MHVNESGINNDKQPVLKRGMPVEIPNLMRYFQQACISQKC